LGCSIPRDLLWRAIETASRSGALDDAGRLPITNDGVRVSALAAAGLRPGDTIASIDGIGLRGPSEMLDIYAALKGRPTVRIAFERVGESQVVECELR
jgi:hypothetical protein